MVTYLTRCAILFGVSLAVVFGGARAIAAPSSAVTAELSARRTTLAEPLNWAIIAHDTSEVEPPTIHDSPDFEVQYRGPQSLVQLVNGDVRRELRFIYVLIPRREGKLHTPHATVTAAGRTYDVSPLEVEVSKDHTAGGSGPVEGISVEQSVDKATVYLGQQLTNTIEIITDRQLVEPQFGDLTFDGFRHLDLGDDQRSTRLVGGRPMTVITLKKALYPIRTGELTIAARELRAKMRIRARRGGPLPFGFGNPFDSGLFDDFFGGGTLAEVRVTSEPLSVTVKPLPPKPAGLVDWSGLGSLVGHTGINVKVGTDPLPFGEARPITIELTSEGNIAPLTSVPFAPSNDFKIYQDPPETKVYDSDGTVVTRKNFKASLVPLRGGTIRVPPLTLSYLDPEAGEYKTTRSSGFDIEVVGGPVPTPTTPHTVSEPPPEIGAGESVERYAPLTTLERLSRQVSLPFAILVVAALGVLGVLLRAQALERKKNGRKRSKWALVAVAPSPGVLRSALIDAFTEELRIPAGASAETIRTELRSRLGSADLEFAFQNVIDSLDRALYGGGEAGVPFDTLRERACALEHVLPRHPGSLRRKG